MAIQKFSDYKKQQEEKQQTVKIQKYSDYAKENNIDYTVNKILPTKNSTGNKVGATLGNLGLLLGKGAVNTGERALDFLNNMTAKTTSKAFELIGRDDLAQKETESRRNFIQRDLTQELGTATGASQQITKNEQNGSLLTRNNLGGQIVQAVGGQLPTLAVGALTGVGGLNSAINSSSMGTLGKIGTTALLNAPTNAMLASSSYGGALQEAYLNGATEEEATKYAIGSTAVEIASEWVTGGIPGTGGKGGIDVFADKGIDKISNKLVQDLVRYGYKMVGEGVEEGIAEILSPILKNATYTSGEKINWQEVLNSAIVGGISAGIIEAPSTVSNISNDIRQNKNNTKLPTVNDLVKQEQNSNTNSNQINLPTVNEIVKNSINTNETTNQSLPVKKLNFIESARKYNIDTNNDTIRSIDKALSQRNITAYWDDTVFKSNKQNAIWKLNSDGTREIIFNPKAETGDLLQSVAVHELYHDLTTSQNGNVIKNEILEFAKTKEGYQEARLDLEKTYSEIYDKNSPEFQQLVDEEAVASILGNKLGEQQFVSQLTMQKPSLARQIYNWVVDKLNTLNKSIGYKSERLFWEDIKNKFENAYREEFKSSQNINMTERHSFIGLKGVENLQETNDNYNEIRSALGIAKFIHNNSTETLENTNRKSIEETGWFKDKNGDWKFEIDDSKATIDLTNVKSNVEYNLKDIINHQELFDTYPELNELKVKFVKMKNGSGEYVAKKKLIKINDNKLNNIKSQKKINSIKATILHETQHLIQITEGFELETHNFLDIDGYIHDLGEIEGQDVRDRIEYTADQRKNILPESAKDNPIHSQAKQLKNSGNEVVKTARKVYNAVKGRGFYEIAEGNNLDDSKSLENETRNDSGIRQFRQRGRELDNAIRNNRQIDTNQTKNQNQVVKKTSKSNSRRNSLDIDEVYNEINKKGDIETQKSTKKGIFYNNGRWGNNINSGQKSIQIEEGLDNSSFSFKQKQLDIILENNPVNDDYHTWIRNVDDIKTFEETLEDTDYKEYYEAGEDFDETYSADMAREALATGKITVYSSYPIKQGIFVSPSKMEAESYSGSGKVYSKEVNLTDIAWIDPTQGQYAKVNNNLYSQQTDKWQEHLNKNYQSTGKGQTLQDVKLPTRKDVSKINLPVVENKKVMNPNEISKMTKEDANTTPILPTIKVSTGDGESKFASNIRNKTDMLSESSKDAILSSDDVKFYEKVTNKESLEKAFEKLNNNGQNETLSWINKKSENATDVDVAEGWILLKQYQDKIANTDSLIEKDNATKEMVQVAKKLREMGTKAGQTVQAFNILNRLTPEGMVYYAQSELSEAFEVMSKNKTKDWIDSNRDKFELTPEETQFIMDTMQEVQQMEDGYDKRVKLAEIQKLMTDKLPPERGAEIKAWMRISMLFNPKTQVRNVVGNAIIAPVNSFSDLFASAVDKQIAKKTGVRTTGNTSSKSYAKGFKTGISQSYNDFKKGINTRNMQGNRFEVTQGKSFNDNSAIGKQLNRVDSFLSFLLDAGDRGFYEASFTNSINNQMILNNTTEVTQEMIDIATNEALSRTWQDNNNYTKFVLNVRNMLNNVNVKGYGLGDVLIPFAKTPANLTKAIVDYSPAGLVKTIIDCNNLRKSLSNGQYTAQMQHQFVQELGKATAGTMLYVLGYALAKAGVVSGESDEDKDVANFMKNTLGVSSYSIKIGNKSFTYDWAQPVAAPLSIMANVVNSKNKETALLEGVVSSLDSAGSILLEQSFLQSINDVLNSNDGVVSGIINEVLELPSRAVPTLMKQIADLIDPVQRTSFEYGKPIESSINSIKAKIPFVSKTLAPSVDTMGREIQKYGGKNNIFNVFLNPANVNTENISESAKEIYRLYKETGETNIMPRVAPYNINKNNEKVILSSQQRTQYQKISGKIIEDSVKELLNNSKYKNMSDTEKTDIINKIVNYSYNKAREEVLNISMSDEYNKVNLYTADDGTVSNYYLNKEEIDYSYNYPEKYKTITQITTYDKYLTYQDEIDTIKDNYENTNQRKNAVISYVNSLNLSIPKKAMLIKMNYSSFDSYNKQIIEYINSQDLSKTEKSEILTKLGFTIKDGKVYY